MGERESPERSRMAEEPEAAAPRPGRGAFNLRNIAILVGGVLISSLFAIFTMRNYVAPAIEQRETALQEDVSSDTIESQLRDLTFYTLDPLLVNPAGSNGERYLKATISLELHDPGLRKEIEKRIPQLKNQINNILSSKSINQIQTTEDRERLRREIQNRVNGLLLSGHVSNVYFEEFVYQ